MKKQKSIRIGDPQAIPGLDGDNPQVTHVDSKFRIILASQSPRRKDLLRELVSDFDVIPADIDEETCIDPDPWLTAQKTAREKALVVATLRPQSLVVSGDTVVAYRETDASPWTQLSKPIDESDACRMLRLLSGRTHSVVTGVCLIWPGGFSAFTETTHVTFKRMSDQEIEEYVATGEPMDKAGAYGFQGGARPFVEKVVGSVTNVIGLPMEKLSEALKNVSGRI